jgi:parallel beta-helix repeat protein
VNGFVVAGNVIKDNTWSGINAVRSRVVVSNNLIHNNRCAGVFLTYEGPSPSLLINNTVVGNQNEADIALWHGARAVIVNNILADLDLEDNAPDAATLLYNDLFGQAATGPNISRDPLFADPDAGDYHLRSQAGRWHPATRTWVLDDVTSPCIDAGDPNRPCGREPCPNGGRMNMGAYGGTPEASKSYP